MYASKNVLYETANKSETYFMHLNTNKHSRVCKFRLNILQQDPRQNTITNNKIYRFRNSP